MPGFAPLGSGFRILIFSSLLSFGLTAATVVVGYGFQSDRALHIDSLQAVLHAAVEDSSRIRLQIALSEAHRSTSRDSARYYAESALTLSREQDVATGMVDAYLILGNLALEQAAFPEAKDHFLAADSICNTNYPATPPAQLTYLLANTYSALGELHKAEALARKSLTDQRVLDDGKSRGLSLNLLRYIALRRNEFEQALQFALKAIDAFEQADYQVGIAGMYNNMGDLYAKLDQAEAAIEQFEKSLAIFQQLGNRLGIRLSSYNIGNRYVELGNYDRALPYLLSGLEISKQSGNQLNLLYDHLTLGDAYAKKGEITRAFNHCKQALRLSETLNRPDLKVYALVSSSLAHEKAGDLIRAGDLRKEAVALARKNGNPREMAYLLKEVSDFYDRSGNYRQALILFRESKAIEDSLFDQERTQRISELQTQYETREKEKEIQILEQANQLQELKITQQRRNQLLGFGGALLFIIISLYLYIQRKKLHRTKLQLESSLTEKETLLKEIHHRVKNNLQLITSLLNLQAGAEPDQKLEDFLYKGQNRVKSMALIHEQLYRSDDISEIDLEQYTRELVLGILTSHGFSDIDCQIKADPTVLDIDQAIPLGLIINELVNNSLKYAFNERSGGRLVVRITRRNDQLEVMVQDDGPGIDSAANQNAMGLRLVRILTQQLKGNFNLLKEEGTTAIIRFPIITPA